MYIQPKLHRFIQGFIIRPVLGSHMRTRKCPLKCYVMRRRGYGPGLSRLWKHDNVDDGPKCVHHFVSPYTNRRVISRMAGT